MERRGGGGTGEIRRKRVQSMRCFTHGGWRLDEVFVRINGERHGRWHAVGLRSPGPAIIVGIRRLRWLVLGSGASDRPSPNQSYRVTNSHLSFTTDGVSVSDGLRGLERVSAASVEPGGGPGFFQHGRRPDAGVGAPGV